jgi:uncharacterized membrane protein SpoIIM required for sporulation
MRQTEFERRHAALWARFEAWLASGTLRRGKNKKATATRDDSVEPLDTAEVPAAYRALCNHLALARERRYGPNLVERLNRLVLSGHHTLYGAASPSSEGFLHFVTAGFPALVRREWRVVSLAVLLFFGPLIGLLVAVQFYPDFASVVIPSETLREMQAMYSPSSHHLGQHEASSRFQMFGFYVWNNIRIGFQTFAGGVLGTLGTLFFLLFNGVYIGVVIGYLNQVGLGPQIWSFVAGHSVFELGAIAISGAAGLKLGSALIAPGSRSRRLALIEDGRIAFHLMGGSALMFFVAAIIEGFWSPLKFEHNEIKYGAGIAVTILMLTYFALAGRDAATRKDLRNAAG